MAINSSAWTGTKHYEFADAVLSCPDVATIFNKTGLNKSKVLDAAGSCDYWPNGEKKFFNSVFWGGIKSLASFQTNYLYFADKGSITLGAGITWKVYSEEELMGVFLHHLGDCAMPVGGHNPASEKCNNTTAEACFEGLIHAIGIKPPAGVCWGFCERGQNELDSAYWTRYCQMFEDSIKNQASKMCWALSYFPKRMAEVWLVPFIGPLLHLVVINKQKRYFKNRAKDSFKYGMQLAHLVVPKYILETKAYKDKNPETKP